MGILMMFAGFAFTAIGIALIVFGIIAITRRHRSEAPFLAFGIGGIALGALLIGFGIVLVIPVFINF